MVRLNAMQCSMYIPAATLILTMSIGSWANVKKLKERIVDNGFPSHSQGTSLAIWDHTVLPATRHK